MELLNNLPDVGDGKMKKTKKQEQQQKHQPTPSTAELVEVDSSKKKASKANQLDQKTFRLKPRKYATCMEKIVILLTIIPMAGMIVTIITGLDAFNLDSNKYLRYLQYVLSFENWLIVTYVYNVVLNPMYFHKFHKTLYNYNFYLQHKIDIEHRKKTVKYCCSSFTHCIRSCCCICCVGLFKLAFFAIGCIMVFVVFFISYANIYQRAYDLAVIIYTNIVGFTLIITVMNVWLSAHLFLNRKGMFTSVYWGMCFFFSLFGFVCYCFVCRLKRPVLFTTLKSTLPKNCSVFFFLCVCFFFSVFDVIPFSFLFFFFTSILGSIGSIIQHNGF